MPEYVSTPNQARNAWVTPYSFEPIPDGGKRLPCTAVSARVAFASTPGNQVVISNLGTETAYVKMGDSSVTATSETDYTIFGQTSVILTISMERITATGPQTGNYIPYTYIAGVTAANSTTLQISTGWGL